LEVYVIVDEELAGVGCGANGEGVVVGQRGPFSVYLDVDMRGSALDSTNISDGLARIAIRPQIRTV